MYVSKFEKELKQIKTVFVDVWAYVGETRWPLVIEKSNVFYRHFQLHFLSSTYFFFIFNLIFSIALIQRCHLNKPVVHICLKNNGFQIFFLSFIFCDSKHLNCVFRNVDYFKDKPDTNENYFVFWMCIQ